jgi:hypothetical protein
MTPGNPFVKTLSALPIDPSVTANSIIAVKGSGPAEEGNDGVVSYQSAHIDGVESELVVRSSHSTQGEPATIEEVRRILLLHSAPRTRDERLPLMTRWLIRIVLFLAGSAALLGVGLVALLVRGPIDLDFLRPRLEGALSSPDGAFRVELATVVLAWDAEERQSEIRGTGCA